MPPDLHLKQAIHQQARIPKYLPYVETKVQQQMPHKLVVVKTTQGFKIRGGSGKLLKTLYTTRKSAQAVIRAKYKK